MNIVVASGKGGTGKTLVATSLALSSPGCFYIDLDVEEPYGYILLHPKIESSLPFTIPIPSIKEEVCNLCGKCADACAFNAITVIPILKKAVVHSDLCHSCGHCLYVCPIEGAIKETNREIGKVRSGINSSIQFIEGRINVGIPSGVPLIRDIVNNRINSRKLNILDAPPGASCSVVECIKKSDRVILVTEPTPFGLSDLKAAISLVKDLRKNPVIIVNKDMGNSIIDSFAHSADIPVVMKIPYSQKIQKAYSEGIPLIDVLPDVKKKFKKLIEYLSN